MDLLDFEGQSLYFEESLAPGVSDLIRLAASRYAEGSAENPLREALSRAPDSLTVLVALYRFYYYQHRLNDALNIADRVLAKSARKLSFPLDWRMLSELHIGRAALHSMAMLRFYLLALKAVAYLKLRLGLHEEGKAILRKLTELDSQNRLGARQLLQVIEDVELGGHSAPT